MEFAGIQIIYQDHHLLVVNKPAGLVIHPTYKHADRTMWDALLDYLARQGEDSWQPPILPDRPEWARAPVHIQEMLRERQRERYQKEHGLLPRPCLLHRLDKDTSGVVALARTEVARRHLVRQFEDHSIVKRYLAVVQQGAPEWAHPRAPFTVSWRTGNNSSTAFERKETLPFSLFSTGGDELLLSGPLQRDPDDRRRCIVGPRGHPATTLVRVLAVSDDEAFAFLDVRLLTGRTHQIRAHLAALGYAPVGDPVYAPVAVPGTPQAALCRQFLHSSRLELRRYPDNAPAVFVAPLADDLYAWMERYFPSALRVLHATTIIPA
jgi:23S rRNA-/tRNA-specific pseudouridylate synthase